MWKRNKQQQQKWKKKCTKNTKKQSWNKLWQNVAEPLSQKQKQQKQNKSDTRKTKQTNTQQHTVDSVC